MHLRNTDRARPRPWGATGMWNSLRLHGAGAPSALVAFVDGEPWEVQRLLGGSPAGERREGFLEEGDAAVHVGRM